MISSLVSPRSNSPACPSGAASLLCHHYLTCRAFTISPRTARSMHRAGSMMYIYCFSRLLSPRLPGACAGQGQSMLFLICCLCSTQLSVRYRGGSQYGSAGKWIALLSILSVCFISIHIVKVHSRNNKHRTSSLLRSSYPTLRHTYKGKTNFFLKASIHTELVLPDCADGRVGEQRGGGAVLLPSW